MNSKNLAWRFLGCVLLIVVLASCSTPTPTPAPTEDIQPTLDAVKTQSVGTAVAALTQNAPTATQTATQTSTPTMTATPLPTFTPLPTATITATFLPLWTATPNGFQASGCTITDFSPKSGTNFAPNEDFDGKWVITNTSNGIWDRNSVDIGYSSGDKLQKSASSYDLTNDVAAGGSYTVTIDMRAPSTAGTYTTTWVVNSSTQVLCTMSLTIVVK